MPYGSEELRGVIKMSPRPRYISLGLRAQPIQGFRWWANFEPADSGKSRF
jgi:hypothetical protein